MGRLPPQAVEIEEAVLGALMLEKEYIPPVLEILKPGDFYKEGHQYIFEAIVMLQDIGLPVDMLTVTQELRAKGRIEFVGGPGYLTDLTLRVGSASNSETHALIIKEKSLRRRAIGFASQLMRDAYTEELDTFEMLDKYEQEYLEITEKIYSRKDAVLADILDRTIEGMREANVRQGIKGVGSGFPAINRIMLGYWPEGFYVIGARPAMGKSLYMLNEAITQAYAGAKVGIISIEMSEIRQSERIISLLTGIDSMRIVRGDLSAEEWNLVQSKRNEVVQLDNLWLEGISEISVKEIARLARRRKAKYGLDILYIDYLQLIEGEADASYGNRANEVALITRSLKKLAGDLKIPIVALSQLTRLVDARAGDNGIPRLSDLRESGSIEQDADVVQFLYRPFYYGITEDDQGRPTEHVIKVLTAKNRQGPLDDVELRYQPAISAITDFYSTPDIPQNVGF